MKYLKHIKIFVPTFLVLFGLLLAACSPGNGPAGVAESQDSLITEAVREYLIAQGAPANDIDVQIEEIEGGFARVQIISSDPAFLGGFTGFLQQVEGDWTPLFVGSGFNTEQVQSLGIPEQILPEGWVLPVDLEPVDDSSNCPTPAAGIAAFANAAHGYCLIYPESYVVEQPNPNETVLVVGSLMNHTDPRVSITVEAANGRSVDQVVDGLLATFDTAAFEIERSDTAIGGEEAIMLDHMPGQDVNRQLFVVHEDVLYHMMFTPFDASLGETFAQAEELFGMVTGSFVFETSLAPESPSEPRSDQFAGANQDSVGWVTNASQRCEYAIDYPSEMQVTDEQAYSRTLGFKLDTPGGVARNFVYVSVIVPEAQNMEAGSIYNYDPAEADILLNMQVGESKPSRDIAAVAQWFTYQRLPDTPIAGHVAQTYENTQPWEFPDGTKEIRHYLSLNECTYLIGAYLDTTRSNQPGAIGEELFNQIVATIQLIP